MSEVEAPKAEGVVISSNKLNEVYNELGEWALDSSYSRQEMLGGMMALVVVLTLARQPEEEDLLTFLPAMGEFILNYFGVQLGAEELGAMSKLVN